jgi:hypothetical protein
MSLVLIAVVMGSGLSLPGSSAAAQQTSSYYREGVLDAANVVTADEQTTGVTGWAPARLIGVQISCTEDSGTATLDIAVQRSFDGTTWATLFSFTQLSATGSEIKTYADVQAASSQMIGDRLRLNYDITGSGQYTCAVAIAGEG